MYCIIFGKTRGKNNLPIKVLQQFIHTESASGIVLLIAIVIALFMDNSPLAGLYQISQQSLLFGINEGFMTLFFLLVGLELKRGFLIEKLGGRQLILPGAAAVGGMIVPAIIYII